MVSKSLDYNWKILPFINGVLDERKTLVRRFYNPLNENKNDLEKSIAIATNFFPLIKNGQTFRAINY